MEWAFSCLEDIPNTLEDIAREPDEEATAFTAQQPLEEPINGKRKREELEATACDQTLKDKLESDAKGKLKVTWRKYGQKVLKGKEYVGMRVLRCYYRCNYPGCKVLESLVE